MFYYSILFKSCLENKVSWIAANQSQSIEGARNCGLSPSLPRIKAPYSFLWILPSEFGYLAIHHSSDEHFESAQVFISCSLLATIGDDKYHCKDHAEVLRPISSIEQDSLQRWERDGRSAPRCSLPVKETLVLYRLLTAEFVTPHLWVVLLGCLAVLAWVHSCHYRAANSNSQSRKLGMWWFFL